MNMNQFTQKSIEALRDTQSIALENGNQQIEQIHLLDALVSKEDGLIPKCYFDGLRCYFCKKRPRSEYERGQNVIQRKNKLSVYRG